ncbi:Uncharacterised protein [uncultured archaeon]|nr:Uncharacterised protein [uncultured archaeon]
MLTDEILIKYPFLPGLKEKVKNYKLEFTPEKIQEAGATALKLKEEYETKKSIPINFETLEKAAEQTILLKMIFQNITYVAPKIISTHYINEMRKENEKDVDEIFSEVLGNNLFNIIEETNVSLYELNFEKGKIETKLEGKKNLIEEFIKQYYYATTRTPEEIKEEVKKQAEKLIPLPGSLSTVNYSGITDHLNHQCIKKIIEGLPEGKRYYGCYALSIACFADQLTLDQAMQVIRDYVKKCSGTAEYSEKEAMATLNWVYKKGVTRLPCNMLYAQGVVTEKCSNMRK